MYSGTSTKICFAVRNSVRFLMSDQEDEQLNALVDIAIESGTAKECITSLDKVNSIEDVSIYILFLIFIGLNAVIGYFAPSSVTRLSKVNNIYGAEQGKYSVYSMSVDNLDPKNSWIKISARYNRISTTEPIAMNMFVNTSVKYTNPKTDHSKHAFHSTNITFTALQKSTHTDWHQVYYERIVDFDGVTAEFVVVGGNEDNFSDFEMMAEYGSFSDCILHIWVKVIYTLVICGTFYVFNERLKVSDQRHEQTLTSALIFATAFYDNPTTLYNYYQPELFVFIFDDILKAFYYGYLVLFVLIMVGHLGSKEAFSFDFIQSRISFAGIYGIASLSRDLLRDLAQIYNPMMTIQHVDKYLILIEYLLFSFFTLRLVVDLISAYKRIDHSEKFRFIVYCFMSLMSIFIIGGTQGLFLNVNCILYITLMGTANVLAVAMSYANYPLTTKESIAYQETNIDDIEYNNNMNNELMDSDGQIDVNGTIIEESQENEEEEIIIIEEEEEEENEETPKNE